MLAPAPRPPSLLKRLTDAFAPMPRAGKRRRPRHR